MKNYDFDSLVFNENIFPSSAYDFHKVPLRRFSFLCIPTDNLYDQPFFYYLKKTFFEKNFVKTLIFSSLDMKKYVLSNNNTGEVALKYFFQSDW